MKSISSSTFPLLNSTIVYQDLLARQPNRRDDSSSPENQKSGDRRQYIRDIIFDSTVTPSSSSFLLFKRRPHQSCVSLLHTPEEAVKVNSVPGPLVRKSNPGTRIFANEKFGGIFTHPTRLPLRREVGTAREGLA
jgi:hypothetical protein